MSAISIWSAPGKWLDHPRLGAIIVACLKARAIASVAHGPISSTSHHIEISGQPSGEVNVRAALYARSQEDARQAVQAIFDAARADGHEMFVRAGPEAETQHDFMIDADVHKGYVRFAVLTTAGPIRQRERAPDGSPMILGFARDEE